jgi:DNA-binding CsgD family transcriptional regulator
MYEEAIPGATRPVRRRRADAREATAGHLRSGFGAQGYRTLRPRAEVDLAQDFCCTTELDDHRPIRLEPAVSEIAAEAVLETLRRGVLIIDSGSRLLFANRSARRFLAHCEVMRLDERGRLVIRNRELEQRVTVYLETTRRAAHRPVAEREPLEPLVFCIDRGGWEGAYRLAITPLDDSRLNARLNGSAPLHVIFVYEPRPQHRLAANMLRQLYGLTATEARVAVLLFDGQSTGTAAHTLSASIHTVRTHIKHIFEKCGVNSQAELAKLLALSAR